MDKDYKREASLISQILVESESAHKLRQLDLNLFSTEGRSLVNKVLEILAEYDDLEARNLVLQRDIGITPKVGLVQWREEYQNIKDEAVLAIKKQLTQEGLELDDIIRLSSECRRIEKGLTNQVTTINDENLDSIVNDLDNNKPPKPLDLGREMEMLLQPVSGIRKLNTYLYCSYSKAGKSNTILKLAVEASKKGLKTLIITPELEKEVVYRRLVSYLTGYIYEPEIFTSIFKEHYDEMPLGQIIKKYQSIFKNISHYKAPFNSTIEHCAEIVKNIEGGVDIVVLDGLYFFSCEKVSPRDPIMTRLEQTLQEAKPQIADLGCAVVATHQIAPRVKDALSKSESEAQYSYSEEDLSDSKKLGWSVSGLMIVGGATKESLYDYRKVHYNNVRFATKYSQEVYLKNFVDTNEGSVNFGKVHYEVSAGSVSDEGEIIIYEKPDIPEEDVDTYTGEINNNLGLTRDVDDDILDSNITEAPPEDDEDADFF